MTLKTHVAIYILLCAPMSIISIKSLSGKGLEGEDRDREGERQLPSIGAEVDICW